MAKGVFNTYNKSKMGNNFKFLLYNRIVLYFVFILAIGNLVYLGTSNDLTTIGIFALVGFLTSFFSKNMIVILCIALVVSAISKYGTSIRVSEGMESGDLPNIKLEDIKKNMGDAMNVLINGKSKKKSKDKDKSNDDVKAYPDKPITGEESSDLDTFTNDKKNTDTDKGNTKVSGNSVSNSSSA
jgi:hypothetical protein